MNAKTKKLLQIAEVLRLAESLIEEFNTMEGNTQVLTAEIKDDVSPVKLHLYGDVRHEIGIDFQTYPTQETDFYFVTEHMAHVDGVSFDYADYAFKEAGERAKMAV